MSDVSKSFCDIVMGTFGATGVLLCMVQSDEDEKIHIF